MILDMSSELLEAYYRAELLLSSIREYPAHIKADEEGNEQDNAHEVTTLLATANIRIYHQQCQSVPTPWICSEMDPNEPNLSVTQADRLQIQHFIVRFIERYLHDKCASICSFLHAKTDISHLQNLPIHIRHLKSKLSAQETHCGNLRDEMQQALSTQLDATKAMIRRLVEMLQTFKQIQARIRVLEHQLFVETYSPSKLDTLYKLSAILADRKAEAVLTRQTLETKLQAYSNNGEEYQSIAQTYRSIQNRIQQKKNWMQTADEI